MGTLLLTIFRYKERQSFPKYSVSGLEPSSEFSSVEKANQLCDYLCTVLNKHAPPSLWKVNHNSSPCFE